MTQFHANIFLEKFREINLQLFLQEEDILIELSRKAAAGRVLLLLDGLDEVHGVGTLDRITLPAGKILAGKFEKKFYFFLDLHRIVPS